MNRHNRSTWIAGVIILALFVFSAWTLGGPAVGLFAGVGFLLVLVVLCVLSFYGFDISGS